MRFLDDLDHETRDQPQQFDPSKVTRRHFDYSCSRCGAPTDREDLVAVVVRFAKLGKSGKTLRTRTKEWLCPPCVEADPVYNSPSYSQAPGMRDVVDKGS